jgi:DNA-binding LacI/PurR family transcriptional regulator
MTETPKLTGIDKIKLAAKANRSVRSVQRAYEGRRVNAFTEAAILEAAKELGLPPPPSPSARQAA